MTKIRKYKNKVDWLYDEQNTKQKEINSVDTRQYEGNIK